MIPPTGPLPPRCTLTTLAVASVYITLLGTTACDREGIPIPLPAAAIINAALLALQTDGHHIRRARTRDRARGYLYAHDLSTCWCADPATGRYDPTATRSTR